MESVLTALEQWTLAAHLRSARWEYAALSAAHILGIALLVGGILPLDLRLMGVWRSVPRAALARVLVPMAAGGLILALATGAILFSVRATDYAAVSVLWAKLAIIAAGTAAAIAAHIRHGLWLERASEAGLRHVGALSLAAWLSALICGRLIAFAG